MSQSSTSALLIDQFHDVLRYMIFYEFENDQIAYDSAHRAEKRRLKDRLQECYFSKRNDSRCRRKHRCKKQTGYKASHNPQLSRGIKYSFQNSGFRQNECDENTQGNDAKILK